MEGDYYDYEKNLAQSFESEQNAKYSEPRKRQRLDSTNSVELKGSPSSTKTPATSAPAKGRSAFHDNFYSDPLDNTSPNQTYHHHHYNPESTTGGYRQYPDPPYKCQPFPPYYGEHNAPNHHSPSSPAHMSNGNARPYYYENHHSGQYSPSRWDPYSYHRYQQFHLSQPWTNSNQRYHPNNDPPKHEHPRHFHHAVKDERPPDFPPHAAPPYPYYYSNYHVNYPQQQYVPTGPVTSNQHESDYLKRPAQSTFYPSVDAMTTHSEGMPVHRTMSLFMACDEDRLSEYQCLARKQIEVFSATYTDLKMTVQGRNRQVIPGQVGIRCRFCSHIPVKKQARASVYYPSKLDCIYQAAQNMASVHLAKYCSYVPEEIRNELHRHMKDRKSSAGGGKEYWAVSARSLGIEECDGRLRFASQPHGDSAQTG